MHLIIPDIHGRTFWQQAVRDHETEKIIFLGDYVNPYIYIVDSNLSKGQPDDADRAKRKVIFLGDYVDPYHYECLPPDAGLRSLRDVIAFKKQHPDNVVLLLGNHDLAYLSDLLPATCRYDHSRSEVIRTCLLDNLDLFSLAHEEIVGGRRVVFSHAGITREWLRDNEIWLGSIPPGEEVTRLNALFRENALIRDSDIYAALSSISWYRGGICENGSCVWADVIEFSKSLEPPLPDCYQVFGHSQQESSPIITSDFACLDCRKAFLMDDELHFTPVGE